MHGTSLLEVESDYRILSSKHRHRHEHKLIVPPRGDGGIHLAANIDGAIYVSVHGV